jgi:membrane protease YdiL (CAAX protease family)
MNPDDAFLPQGGQPQSSLVPLALAFYAAMGLVAVVWRLASDGQTPFLAERGAALPGGGLLLCHTLLGLLAGGGVVVISRLCTRYSRAGRTLAVHLAAILGPLSGRSVVVLALASGLGEEAFFRGALQPQVGLPLACLLFGLAHLIPRRELAPWAAFAALAGVILGALFECTGNLVAPATAHALINGVNLRWLSRLAASREHH